nr:MAG TPA: hypothetical protein [Caudoviricetes sp.]
MEIILQKRCHAVPLFHLPQKEKKGLYLKQRTLLRQTKAVIVEKSNHILFFHSHGLGEGI